MRGLLARINRRLRGAAIQGPAYIIAAPYCSGGEVIAQRLLDEGVANRMAPEDLPLLHRHKTLISEANASVQTHLTARVFLKRHTERVRHILSPVTARFATHDLFVHGPFGQTVVNPYVCKAVIPHARFIWVTKGRKDWLSAVEHLECAHPAAYPEHIGWLEDRAGREELLLERRQKERRKFLRLANDFPDDCLDLKWVDPDFWEKLAAFTARPWPTEAPYPEPGQYADEEEADEGEAAR